MCHHCHWHLSVTVEFMPVRSEHAGYCPTRHSPLHHFAQTSVGRPSSDDGKDEKYFYRCTVCPTAVRIDYRPPRLSHQDLILLVDPDLLEQRLHNAVIHDAQREGLEAQHAINVVEALATYIRDAVSGEPNKTKKMIPVLNKRWMLSFGEDCEELLARLGFTKTEDGQSMSLPQVPMDGALDPDSKRATLLDVREELLSFILTHFSKKERERLKWVTASDLQSNPDPGALVKVMLGAGTYDHIAKRFDGRDEPFYAALGAMHDFSDDLILYAFDRQTYCDRDSDHPPYYLDCLTAIANTRNSENLQLQLAKLVSEGYYGRSDIDKAYSYFNIDLDKAADMSDDLILGIFQARLGSEPVSRVAEMRQQLRIIGEARHSTVLQNSAANSKSL